MVSTPGPGDRPLIAVGRVLVIAVPVAVGLWIWRVRPEDRFGPVLVVAGYAWFLPTLAESGDDALYSLGRVGVWVAEPVLAYLMLSFPSGRLTGRIDRLLVWGMAALVAVLFLPTAFLVERYPEPAPYTSCSSCPDNAFLVPAAEPAFVDAWVYPVREALAAAAFAAVLVILAGHVRRATHLMRLTLTPVLAVAIVRALIFVVFVIVRNTDEGSPFLDAVAWFYVLSLPGIAVAFLVGLLRAKLYAGEALRRLALALRARPGPEQLTAILRETMEDPSLELAYWAQGRTAGWVDAAGRRIDPPAPGAGRVLTPVRDGGRNVAALVHDTALRDQEEFVEAAGTLALGSLENQRLTARIEASLRELSDSRARMQAAADDERRRIERDLHDGAQQRLVALRIRLGLYADLVREDPEGGAALIRELAVEAEEALEEVRSLAHGVYPSLLADRGLAEALRALARSGPVATRVEADALGHYPPEVESAVYFCCLEALQNAAKHARDATAVVILVTDDGVLRFEVHDDGRGFAEVATKGAGFTNMHDRLAAVGGELSVHSEPGSGTRVVGTIPSAQGRP